MKHVKHLIIAALIACVASCTATKEEDEMLTDSPILPKKELRGAWITTAWEIDWPMGNYSPAIQKQKYIDYLDLFVAHNINAVFFQIRGMADSFYESPYESWSKYITGVAGKKPDYDVLKFLIDEAHKRNIQFHAWLNPYRVATRASKTSAFPPLDTKIPAELVKDYEKIRIYNPALPEVQNRLANIVKDIITKYDVDGIHLDDYFYPSLEASEQMNDGVEFEKYGNGAFTKVEDFRRNNVNTAVKKIQTTIIETKPDVVFSISPAANNDHNYNVLFADVLKWSQEGWVDVLIPQLYFATGTAESSFTQRLSWWSQFSYKSHLLIGYGVYKFGDPTTGAIYQDSEDLKRQFGQAQAKEKVKGGVLYSAKNLTENKVGILNVIKETYKTPTLLPYLGRSTATKPTALTNLVINGDQLSWEKAENVYYAVYKSNGNNQVASLIGTTQVNSFKVNEKGIYYVTVLSKNQSESDLSNPIAY